jgi:tripartite-type tricarboxylate transporter receptor subunit TctC
MNALGRFAGALLGLAVGLALPVSPGQAADWPTKPIRLVVPYPPGGATDIVMRLYQPYVSESLGQQLIVENKPGGGTNIGAEYVAKSAPDGYTLFAASFASHAVNRHLFRKIAFHAVNDFTQVAMTTKNTLFLCVKPGSPFKSVAEIIDFAKKNPGKMAYGSAGNGSPNHISGELLKQKTGIDVLHVPYRGAADLVKNLLAGQVDFGFDASIIVHHRSGKLKCLATTNASKWPTDPDLPPVAATVPDFEVIPFFGIVGPKGIDAKIVEKLNAAFVKAAKQPEIAKKLAITAALPYPASVEETKKFLTEQDTKWADVVKKSGAKVD